ncbi:MAG: hypothetical protein AABZ08_04685 [Planctomycetota bacterium]
MATFDEDGPGPLPAALIVGGEFETAGGVTVNHVARWNGTEWSALGEGLIYDYNFFSSVVRSLAVFDEDGDGPGLPSLFAAGLFSRSGSVIVNSVARWNGTSWVPLGPGLFRFDSLSDSTPGLGTSLCVYDSDGDGSQQPVLIVGGNFARCGTTLARNVAMWDGTQWQPLGTGCGTSSVAVSSLGVVDMDGTGPANPTLFAAGGFVTAGGISANRIAAWNGTSWSALGSGLNQPPNSMLAFDQDGLGPTPTSLLVVGDFFSTAGGTPVKGFAVWNGSNWAPLGNERLASYGTACMFDGDGSGPGLARLFATIQSTNGNELRYWNGTAWENPDRAIRTNNTLFAINAMHSFISVGATGVSESLIVAGDFESAGPAAADSIAAYRDGNWTSLGSGVTDWTIDCLGEFDPDGPGALNRRLLAGGQFSQICGVSATYLAQWDGMNWSEFPGITAAITEFSYSIRSICEFDEDGPAGARPPLLFIGGGFTLKSDGVVTKGIAKWNGTKWLDVGGGLSFPSTTNVPGADVMAVFDDDGPGPHTAALFVAGHFELAGKVPVKNIAKWDGTTWHDVAGGLADHATCLCVYDTDHNGPNPPELYVGGFFHYVGQNNSVPGRKMARWNGVRWAALGSGLSTFPATLEVFDDDGRGPHPPCLYVGGDFSQAGGQAAAGMARWDGQSWYGMDGGLQSGHYGIRAMKSFSSKGIPSLFFGGDFIFVDHQPTNYFAQLQGCKQTPGVPSSAATDP